MMAALIAGGMSAAWSKERNQLADHHADGRYHPNRSGLYEVPLKEYSQVGFPRAYEGKLIKVMCWGMNSLAVHDYRIVIMRRDKEEIRQSYEGFFGSPLREAWFQDYDARMIELERQLRNRKDVRSVSVIDYRSLVENPHKQLSRLYGWDFNVDKAAAAIDPQQYRFRLENLTVGI